MTTKHTLSRADETFAGNAYHVGYDAANSLDGRAGIKMSHILVKNYGAAKLLKVEGFLKDATSTEMPNASTKTWTTADDGASPIDLATYRPTVSTIQVAGANVSVWVMDVPRNVTTGNADAGTTAALTITVTGYDEYYEAMSEVISSPATATSVVADGLKAFKYVKSIAVYSAADATANTLDVGFGDVLGLPVRCDLKGDFIVYVDGAIDAATKVVADSATATTTTGDVRGTWNSSSALDSTKKYSVWINIADRSTKAAAFGVTQA